MTGPSALPSVGPPDRSKSEVRGSPSTSEWTLSVNGVLQPLDIAHVSARDRGFTLADGLFETMRVRNGRIFRLDRHLARLAAGLIALRIPTVSTLDRWVQQAVDAARPVDGSVRLTVTRGISAGGLAPPVDARPTVVVAVGPMPAFAPAIYESGLSAHVASGTRNEHAMTSGLKTLAFVESVAGLLEAQRAGADEALFLDTGGHCSEATASNLFAWTGDTLLTPPLTCGALPGITRATVLELAYGLGFETSDRAFGLGELVAAKEAFLTSSLRGIAPLVRVNGHPLGNGMPGSTTREIAAAYGRLVERECSA
jgi:branched-chain amino acid aminotransferase